MSKPRNHSYKEESKPANSLVKSAQCNVWELISAYRAFGFLYAKLDPLNLAADIFKEHLDLDKFKLRDHLQNEFQINADKEGKRAKLEDIIHLLNTIYCSSIGFEFNHLVHLQEREWLQNYIESNYLSYKLTASEKQNILYKLLEAEELEKFLEEHFPNQDRYSISGVESLLPALDRLISQCASKGFRELLFGMQHRGRVNVQVNLMGKEPRQLFSEFKKNYDYSSFVTTGDNEFHEGCKCTINTQHGPIKVTVAYNPSHLEIINPIVSGMVRARQDACRRENKLKNNIMGILLHGDAAFCGLGTNQGLFNMSRTKAYDVEGIIHLVVNNQLGRTTEPREGRSTLFCTDIAKMVSAPIIHINADDVESVLFAIDLAVEYREKFKKDIVLDLVCFRRHGHEETEDPTQTQPHIYQVIDSHPGLTKMYANKLIAQGLMTEEAIKERTKDYRQGLTAGVHINAQNMPSDPWYNEFEIQGISRDKNPIYIKTAISEQEANKIFDTVIKLPNPKFRLHPKLNKIIKRRSAMARKEDLVDFGMAETLAFGSLLQLGISVRLCGEDSCRSVFQHRHAVWFNQGDSSPLTYIPLSQLENNGSEFSIFNSTLNEECAMGFEYGYSTVNMRDLVIWEAYSGDFANGAQVIIDQFIATAEYKWGQLSGITLFLPHGFGGGGPEHSSARIERFLQLSAENNMVLAMPTTAAQFFHLLRRKALNKKEIKPLIVFIPKRLLNDEQSKSPLSEIIAGKFNEIIPDESSDCEKVKVIILCSGQIYYDIIDENQVRKLEDITVIRLEQLYPFPNDSLIETLKKYKNGRHLIWVQEEPYNQGSWIQLRDELEIICQNQGLALTCVSSEKRAAPVHGNPIKHQESIRMLIERLYEYLTQVLYKNKKLNMRYQ